MIEWLKSKFLKNYVQPIAYTVWYQETTISPWLAVRVQGVPVMVRTKKEARELRVRLNREGVWNTKILPVRNLVE